MGPKSKKEYFLSVVKRYKHVLKKYKSQILDEFCKVCRYNRKYAIHKLNSYKPLKPKKKPGRPSKYNQPLISLRRLKRFG